MPERARKPRRQLPFADWPEADRRAWDALFREGDVFDNAGPARHWKPQTRTTNRKHYAQWLGWLAATGQLDPEVEPWRRATPETVTAYGRSLMERIAPKSVQAALTGLKRVLMMMRGGEREDWRWLLDLTARTKAWARPSIDRSAQMLPLPEIYDAVLAELERLSPTDLARSSDLLAFRDALMLGIFATCAPRARSLRALEVDRHVVRCGTDWRIRLFENDTKTGQEQTFLMPVDLAPFITRYLEHVRPTLLRDRTSPGFFVTTHGGPLAPHSVYERTRRTAERLLGVAIHPHLFRSIAATFLAEASPDDRVHASALLGHRDLRTTEAAYIRADRLKAGRTVTTALQEIRDA